MGGSSAARRYAGLFEERVLAKAAKGTQHSQSALGKGAGRVFCGYPFKPFFIALRVQGILS